MTKTIRCNIWVCTDCYFAHHYGVREHDGKWYAGESDEPSELKPLGKVWDDELTDNTCADHDGTDDKVCTHCREATYEDGMEEFTWRSCDGCGSHLGGSRHRLAVWE